MHKRCASKSNNRRKAHAWGIIAEYLCAALLLCKGYSIITMRHRNHSGEIDIIAARGKTLVFTEVKARTDKNAAVYSVTPAKQYAVTQAASGFIASHAKYASHDLRFDVMVVTSPVNIHHIKDAWRT